MTGFEQEERNLTDSSGTVDNKTEQTGGGTAENEQTAVMKEAAMAEAAKREQDSKDAASQPSAYTLKYVPAGQPAAYEAFNFSSGQAFQPAQQMYPQNAQQAFTQTGPTAFSQVGPSTFLQSGPAAFPQAGAAAFPQAGAATFPQAGPTAFPQTGPTAFPQGGQQAYYQQPYFHPGQQPGYPASPNQGHPGFPAAPNQGYPGAGQAFGPDRPSVQGNAPFLNPPAGGGFPGNARTPGAMGGPGGGNRPGSTIPRPSPEQYEELKTAPFYNESYRKAGKGNLKGILAPMIVVGLLCSVLGAAVSIAWFQYFGPTANAGAPELGAVNSADIGTVRKVEIVDKTDSPVTAIAEKAGPSVVGINVEYTYNDSFFGTQDGGGQGSGIIISSDGYIITNNHVVEAAANSGSSKNRFANSGKITVILPNQKDHPYEATIVGLDAKTDIAIIKIDAENLPVAEIGDSGALRVGEMAVAIGNPAGLEYMGSVTAGIISGLNREVDTGDGTMLRLIQTDAAISPGNSGGALLNSKGQVVGINSSKIGGSSYEGLGFAIPIKDAMDIAESLMKDGIVIRPQIGVSIDNTFTADVAKANEVPEGVLVGDVMTGGSAEKGGIQAGDIITKFNGVRVSSFDELEEQKNLKKPGDKVTMEVYRIPEGKKPNQGEYKTLNIELGSTADANQ